MLSGKSVRDGMVPLCCSWNVECTSQLSYGPECKQAPDSSPVALRPAGGQQSAAVLLLDSLPSMPLRHLSFTLPQHLPFLHRFWNSRGEDHAERHTTATLLVPHQHVHQVPGSHLYTGSWEHTFPGESGSICASLHHDGKLPEQTLLADANREGESRCGYVGCSRCSRCRELLRSTHKWCALQHGGHVLSFRHAELLAIFLLSSLRCVDLPLVVSVEWRRRLLCGAVSCLYLSLHRLMLHLITTNAVLINMLKTEKALYSAIVAFFLASLTFPDFVGQHMASKFTMKQLLTSLLENTPWTSQSHNASGQPETEWGSSQYAVFPSLTVFLLMKLWMSVLACTLPLPAGYFMPVFIYGAALGRLLAEGILYVSSSPQEWSSINPGGYALAGAAAFSGAVTHTLSPALLALELTGQFSHVVPVLLATLLANGVARSGNRPSFYDAVSISKRLPHMPSLAMARPGFLSKQVGHVLGATRVQLQKAAGPEEVRHVVNKSSSETQIPVVDSHEAEILLGFVMRSDLLTFLRQCGTSQKVDGRLEEICSIQPSSALLCPDNTIQEAFSILSLVGGQTVFVTDRGRLLGRVTWSEMRRILEDLAKEI
ncbi:chloride channel K isoform X2 [Vanacampus margaritifer]